MRTGFLPRRERRPIAPGFRRSVADAPSERNATGMTQLEQWLDTHDGIAHRHLALAAGFSASVQRARVQSGTMRVIRRYWLARPHAPASLVAAAEARGRVTCVTLARERGWWMPEAADPGIHLHKVPGSGGAHTGGTNSRAGAPEQSEPHVHWMRPLEPAGPYELRAPAIDALAHIAACQPWAVSRVLWESASRIEGLSPELLRRVAWTSNAANQLASATSGLSDSGLETLVVVPLEQWGLRIRQQVLIAGHRVDVVIGDALVIQIDGYEFHSDSSQRSRDIAHDAELRLRGYTVLRLSYRQIVHEWPATADRIRRMVAQGLHRRA